MSNLRPHHSGSPFARAVLATLEKGRVSARAAVRRHPVASTSPPSFGRVPAFEHNGFCSTRPGILRYLDRVLPEPS